jgi:DNA-binding PadR family transcriptional regulator
MKDIEKVYSEALISKPKNINDIMNANQRKGYLVAADQEKDNLKAWKITSTGEEYVRNMK